MPFDVKVAKERNRVEVYRALDKFLNMTKEQVNEAIKDPNTPALELMIAGIVSKGAVHGDQKRLGFLLDRMVGPVVRQVEVTGNAGGPIKYQDLSEDKLTEERERLKKITDEEA